MPKINLERLNIYDELPLPMVTAKSGCDFDTLVTIVENNRDFFLSQIHSKGVLLFRGFLPRSPGEFSKFFTKGFAFDIWNSFNTIKMPAIVADWLRRYSERLLGGGDYRTYLDKNTVQLGPADTAVQGPHVEGGVSSNRARYLALCCFEPAPQLGETGIVDLHQVFKDLPHDLQQKYATAWNRFFYTTKRRVHIFDRILLSLGPFKVIRTDEGLAKLALAPCPFVCANPETGQLCLQPWPFARNTINAVHSAAKRAFPDRGEITKDITASAINLTWELLDNHGDVIAWSEDEQKNLFEHIFKRAILIPWQKGDIALIDNIRIGHWRMNGVQGNRKLVQIQAEPFNANDHRSFSNAAIISRNSSSASLSSWHS